ncbi:MAG: acyltransferase [Polaromonas sp.]|uniref:acyltransferase family protein n=1 Tax=Polaromonas sp. TaxID=1869339 RepID=UPI0024894132|nr:acyltransferase [Polaromonas sp.]MDI1269848.1 acyltransferase [Polaromonas sp.]
MLGTWRFFLAICVVASHLCPRVFGVHFGSYAVFAFYICSGYLMTKIINETYGYSILGVARFILNRFLRIYPTYWTLLALALLLGAVNGLLIRATVWTAPYMPITMQDWLKNLLIIGLNPGLTTPIESNPAALTTAWSLSVELIFYALISLGFSRSRVVTIIWFACSLVVTCAMIFLEYDFAHRYFPFAAASLPFSMGAILHWWRPKLPSWSLGCLLLSFILILVLGANGTVNSTFAGMYIALFLSFLIQGELIKVSCANTKIKETDNILGDLSYPIFLIHMVAGFFAVAIVGVKTDLWILGLGLCTSMAVGFLVITFIEKPIKRIRAQVRSG